MEAGRTLRTVHGREADLLLGAAAVPTMAAVALLGVAGCAAGPAVPPGAGVAPSVTVAGKTIPYDGPQAWSVASISSRGSKDLPVFAVGSDRMGGGECGPPVVRLHATETKTQIRVLVADYQQTPGV